MTPRALTADQIRTAAQIAAQEGVTIEIRSGERLYTIRPAQHTADDRDAQPIDLVTWKRPK